MVLFSNKQPFCFHYTIDLFSNRQTFCFHYNTVCFQISNRFVITMQPFCKLLKIILGFVNIIFCKHDTCMFEIKLLFALYFYVHIIALASIIICEHDTYNLKILSLVLWYVGMIAMCLYTFVCFCFKYVFMH